MVRFLATSIAVLAITFTAQLALSDCFKLRFMSAMGGELYPEFTDVGGAAKISEKNLEKRETVLFAVEKNDFTTTTSGAPVGVVDLTPVQDTTQYSFIDIPSTSHVDKAIRNAQILTVIIFAALFISVTVHIDRKTARRAENMAFYTKKSSERISYSRT